MIERASMIGPAPIADRGTFSSAARPSLIEEIAHLLVTETGEEFLKKLFWEVLKCDPVNEPIPLAVLPAEKREDVELCKILGRASDICVCYIHLRVSELSPRIERAILDSLGRSWPAALVVFSNSRETERDFWWESADLEIRAVRLLVDQELHGMGKLARLLARLSAVDPISGQEHASLELVRRWDQVFRQLAPLARQRPELDHLGKIVSSWPLLKRDDEKNLAARWEMNRDPEARLRLICCNLRLVLRVANRFRGSGADFEDLFQEGCIALIHATEKFKPARGYKFATYATWWIRQSIQRAVQTKAIGSRNRSAIVPSKLTDGAAQGFAESPEYLDLQEAIEKALRALKPRAAEIVRRRFGLGKDPRTSTLEELGAVFHLTRERIRQIEVAACERLRKLLRQFEPDVGIIAASDRAYQPKRKRASAGDPHWRYSRFWLVVRARRPDTLFRPSDR
jgi:RNA polymerase sigma factor (sigma-70 family)